MKPENMKSLSEAKPRHDFRKTVKLHFLLFFGLFYDFLKNFTVRFMYEDDLGPT